MANGSALTSPETTDTKDLQIPPEVARHLGYYVYIYADPRNGEVLYVGKGQGERVLAHLAVVDNSKKSQAIQGLLAAGYKPRLDILAHGLADEETAFRIEAAVIDAFGLKRLTNQVRGWRSVQTGRMPLKALVEYYAAKAVTVSHPALLIRINQLYRHEMTDIELYEATRGVWWRPPGRERAKFAMAVFEGVVREVYQIDEWHPAGTTPYLTRQDEDLNVPGRWEFTGHRADEAIRSLYVGGSVAVHFKKGQQSPVVYAGA